MSNVTILHPDISPNSAFFSLFQFPPSFAPTPTHITPRCWHPSMISCEGSNGVTPCPALLALLRDLARSLHAVGPHVSSCPDTSYGSAAPLPQPPETFLDASMTVSPLPISQPVNVASSIASLRIQASRLNLLTREANRPLCELLTTIKKHSGNLVIPSTTSLILQTSPNSSNNASVSF